jgi:hypothetical protein
MCQCKPWSVFIVSVVTKEVPPIYPFELGMLDNFDCTQGKWVSPCRHIGIGLNLTSFNTAHQLVCHSHHDLSFAMSRFVIDTVMGTTSSSVIQQFQLAGSGANINGI